VAKLCFLEQLTLPLNEAEIIAKKMNDELFPLSIWYYFCFKSKVAQILKDQGVTEKGWKLPLMSWEKEKE
jgi:ATP-dependent Clp protease ATP-binding subunit ClpB